jgi:uncharacterized protein with GYD domain
MSKYAVFFTLKGEAIARAMDQPSDRVMVVSKAVESAGGKLEAYDLMFGQYDGFVIVDLPDSRAAAATSLAVSSTGAFEHLETHELIEAEDLNPILEQAKGITASLVIPLPHRWFTAPLVASVAGRAPLQPSEPTRGRHLPGSWIFGIPGCLAWPQLHSSSSSGRGDLIMRLPASCGYRRITVQVRVRVTPSTTWMRETTSRPS